MILLGARNPNELDNAIAEVARRQSGAFGAVSDLVYDSQPARIAEFAVRSKLPSI